MSLPQASAAEYGVFLRAPDAPLAEGARRHLVEAVTTCPSIAGKRSA